MPKFIEKSPRGHSCMRASVGGKSVVTPQTFASQTRKDPLLWRTLVNAIISRGSLEVKKRMFNLALYNIKTLCFEKKIN